MNFMKSSSVDFTVIDDIIPSLDPTPDYIGVSLSSLPEHTHLSDLNSISSKLTELLDYAASKLPAKEGVQGPRVLISEAAFPLITAAGAADGVTGTQELQVNSCVCTARAVDVASCAGLHQRVGLHSVVSRTTLDLLGSPAVHRHSMQLNIPVAEPNGYRAQKVSTAYRFQLGALQQPLFFLTTSDTTLQTGKLLQPCSHTVCRCCIMSFIAGAASTCSSSSSHCVGHS
jgi:hypothetical protein